MKKIVTKYVSHGGSVTPPDHVEYVGYNFLGWDKSLSNVIENMNVLTQYQIKTYTVKFVYNGVQKGSDVIVEYGQKALYSGPSMEKEGYNFVWDNDKYIYENTTITGDYFLADGYFKVNFYDRGNLLSQQIIKSGKSAIPPENPVDQSGENYFIGWQPSYSNIMKHTDCHSQWKKIENYITIKGTEKYQKNSSNDDIQKQVDIFKVLQTFTDKSFNIIYKSGKLQPPFEDLNSKMYWTYVQDNSEQISAIVEECFCGSWDSTYVRNMQTAIFPSVINVGKDAFNGNKYLKTISMPNLETCGQSAFRNSMQQDNVNLDFPKLKDISELLFAGCSKLCSFKAEQAKSVGNSAFSNCSYLTDVILPNVESIGSRAFYQNRILTNIDIRNVISIEKDAFYCSVSSGGLEGKKDPNTSLTTLYMPNVTYIDKESFKGIYGVTSLTISKNISIASNLWGLGSYKDGVAKNKQGGSITITVV